MTWVPELFSTCIFHLHAHKHKTIGRTDALDIGSDVQCHQINQRNLKHGSTACRAACKETYNLLLKAHKHPTQSQHSQTYLHYLLHMKLCKVALCSRAHKGDSDYRSLLCQLICQSCHSYFAVVNKNHFLRSSLIKINELQSVIQSQLERHFVMHSKQITRRGCKFTSQGHRLYSKTCRWRSS